MFSCASISTVPARRRIATGLGFFDHMLELVAGHGLFDLTVDAKGDLQTGGHHTVEDVGICLGTAIAEAVGDKRGINRYGSMLLPMDECAGARGPRPERPALLRLRGRSGGRGDRRVRRRPGGGVLPGGRQPRPHDHARSGTRRRRPAPHHRGGVQGLRQGAAAGGRPPTRGRPASRRPKASCESAAAVSGALYIVDYGSGNLRSVQKAFEHVGVPPWWAPTCGRCADAAGPGAARRGRVRRGHGSVGEQGTGGASAGAHRGGRAVPGRLSGSAAALRGQRGGPGGRRAWASSAATCGRCRPRSRCRTSAGTRRSCAAAPTCSTDIPDGSAFYFVHSYAVVPRSPGDVSCMTDYDGVTFVSGIEIEQRGGGAVPPGEVEHARPALLPQLRAQAGWRGLVGAGALPRLRRRA